MPTFDPTAYGPAFAELLTPPRRMPLGPGKPNQAARPKLEALQQTAFAHTTVHDRNAASACVSGLWLYHDYLDESHTISQALHTPEGSFWHAIMHRREPDAWNSKYWWNRVGEHPVLQQLREQAPTLGYDYTGPEAFVDYCERVRGKGGEKEDLAMRVQGLEWELLFGWCFGSAISG